MARKLGILMKLSIIIGFVIGLVVDNGIYKQNAINKKANIYLLSERGYAKLLKILEDDTAWELYSQFVDGYFNMGNKK